MSREALLNKLDAMGFELNEELRVKGQWNWFEFSLKSSQSCGE